MTFLGVSKWRGEGGLRWFYCEGMHVDVAPLNTRFPQVNADISVGHALVVELFITFELVFTVFATCDPKRDDLRGSSGLAIGLAVCIGHLFAVSPSQGHVSVPFFLVWEVNQIEKTSKEFRRSFEYSINHEA